ncbi:hypothetical protein AgCh_015412 [Apium graveolens]
MQSNISVVHTKCSPFFAIFAAENGDVVKSKMEDYQVIEQIGRGAFEAAFLVLHKFETRSSFLIAPFLYDSNSSVWWAAFEKEIEGMSSTRLVGYIFLQNFTALFIR